MPKLPGMLRLKGRLVTGEVWVNGKPLSRIAASKRSITAQDFRGAMANRDRRSSPWRSCSDTFRRGTPFPCIGISGGSLSPRFRRKISRRKSTYANGSRRRSAAIRRTGPQAARWRIAFGSLPRRPQATTMHFDDHVKHTLRIYGRRADEVHNFPDRFFPKYRISHRRLLHHRLGVALAVKKFGEKAWGPAELHIIDDLGCVPDTWLDHNPRVVYLDPGDDVKQEEDLILV